MARFTRLSHLGLCVSEPERSLALHRALGLQERSRPRVSGEPAGSLLGVDTAERPAVHREWDDERIELAPGDRQQLPGER